MSWVRTRVRVGRFVFQALVLVLGVYTLCLEQAWQWESRCKTADTKTDLVVSWRPTQNEPAGELVINPKALSGHSYVFPKNESIHVPGFKIIIVGASPPPPSVTTRTGVPTIGWGIYLAKLSQHKPQPNSLRHSSLSVAQLAER